MLYSLLIEVGRLGANALDNFNQDGSSAELIGAEHSSGHEVTAGSLGQAISQAGGIAPARMLRGDTGRVWVFMPDGEFPEGQTWEAFAALAHHRIDNLGVYVEANGQQCDAAMASVMNVEPLAARLAAFGAAVFEVDGHDPLALAAAAENTTRTGRWPCSPAPTLAAASICSAAAPRNCTTFASSRMRSAEPYEEALAEMS